MRGLRRFWRSGRRSSKGSNFLATDLHGSSRIPIYYCHPEAAVFAAEGPMHFDGARRMHRSFPLALLRVRMTNQKW